MPTDHPRHFVNMSQKPINVLSTEDIIISPSICYNSGLLNNSYLKEIRRQQNLNLFPELSYGKGQNYSMKGAV
jgi:hypothetical protein